jgi:hypothetical protein
MLSQPSCLVLLVDAARQAGQIEEGLRLVAEAIPALQASGRGQSFAGGSGVTHKLYGHLRCERIVARGLVHKPSGVFGQQQTSFE